MAQKRMLNKSISVSEQVANISKDAQLFYTWSIAHADDFGLIWNSPKKLKAVVVPYWDVTEQTVTGFIKELIDSKLWECARLGDQDWFCFPKWFDHQKLRKDIKPEIYAYSSAEWSDYEAIKSVSCNVPLRNVTHTDGFVKEEKRSKEKIREEKIEHSLEFLKNIPDEVIKEFSEKFNVYEQGIKEKAEDLYNYCKAKNKKYSDYKAFLRNAVKKDFGIRKMEAPKPWEEAQNQPVSKEGLEKLAEMKKKLKFNIKK